MFYILLAKKETVESNNRKLIMDQYKSPMRGLDLSNVKGSSADFNPGRGRFNSAERIKENPDAGTHRSAAGVSGYLFKTAQHFSTFQRKQFYRRFYELNEETRQLRICEKRGGQTKDVVFCHVTHVTKNLSPQLRKDYKQFFAPKAIYSDVNVDLPAGFALPFAVFMQDGSMSVLWAASEMDLITWTDAFKSLIPTKLRGRDRAFEQFPFLPELTDQNYFVATLYMCLLPENLLNTDIDALESHRSLPPSDLNSSRINRRPTSELSNKNSEVVITETRIGGWLTKTAQELGLFQSKKFLTRYYTLNSVTSTLIVSDGPDDSNAPTIFELRRNRLVKVDTDLKNQLEPGYKRFFQKDSSVMLLWARQGKDYKIWSRAFKRFINLDRKQQADKTTWWVLKQEHCFVLALMRALMPTPDLNTDALETPIEEQPTVEGWLCKTAPHLPTEMIGSTWLKGLKTYCILDLKKLELTLHSKHDGKVQERFKLGDRLCAIDTNLVNRIDSERVDHHICDEKLLEGLKMPQSFSIPFSLHFNDGDIVLFWCSSTEELDKWQSVYEQLLTPRLESQQKAREQDKHWSKYCLRTKDNSYVTTLYQSLERKDGNYFENVSELASQNADCTSGRRGKKKKKKKKKKHVQAEQFDVDEIVQGQLFECIQSTLPDTNLSSGAQEKTLFMNYHYMLDVKRQVLQIFESSGAPEPTEEIFLTDRVCGVVTDLSHELRSDSKQLSNGILDRRAIDLPSSSVPPFAVHLKEGGLMIFWSAAHADRNRWLRAFKSLIPKDQRRPDYHWIELTRSNFFSVSLYRCLMPELETAYLQGGDEQNSYEQLDSLESIAHVAVAKVDHSQETHFVQHYIRLNQDQLSLELFSGDRRPVDSQKPVKVIELRNKLCKVDFSLQNELIAEHEEEFGSQIIDELVLPYSDSKPLGLVFDDGEVLLIWLESSAAYDLWLSNLGKLIARPKNDQAKIVNFVIRNKDNYFSLTLYKCLVRSPQEYYDDMSSEQLITARDSALASFRGSIHGSERGSVRGSIRGSARGSVRHDSPPPQIQEDSKEEEPSMVQDMRNQADLEESKVQQKEAPMIVFNGAIKPAEEETKEPTPAQTSKSAQSPNKRNRAQSTQEALSDEVSGWLTKTHEGQLSNKDEPFVTRYFRLDMHSGVLSEYQDNQRSRKLDEVLLLRRMVHIEVNISNKLREETEDIFQKYDCKMPKNLKLPASKKLRPVAIHFVSGELMIFWVPTETSEFDKWLAAFNSLKIKTWVGGQDSKASGDRLEIFIKSTPDNCFTLSLFHSLLPLKILKKTRAGARDKSGRGQKGEGGEEASTVRSRMLTGCCLKTAQDVGMLQTDVVFRRYYTLDATELKIHKTERGKISEFHPLDQISWVERRLTNKLKEGFQDILNEEGISVKMHQEFQQSKTYKHPLAIGMQDGELQVLWFETEHERDRLGEALIAYELSNPEPLPGQKYLIRQNKNAFVSSVYRTLRLKEEVPEDPRVLRGMLGRAVNKRADMFKDQFVILDTRTGLLSFFTDPFTGCIEAYELRFCRVFDDLDCEKCSVELPGQNKISWTWQQKPFAVHVGGALLVFMAKDKETFLRWTQAFKSLEIAKFNELQLWVDQNLQRKNHVKFVEEMSPMVTNESKQDAVEQEARQQAAQNSDVKIVSGRRKKTAIPQLSGFLCKTSQIQTSTTKQIFYKRFYAVNYQTNELMVRNHPGKEVKEIFDLKSIVQVDTSLKRNMAPQDYRPHFKSYFSNKIALPREFAFPFALLFEDGSIQILLASTQKQFDEWTKAMKAFEQPTRLKYKIWPRHQYNFFVATLYMCLSPQKPAILLDTKFERRNLADVMEQTSGKQTVNEETLMATIEYTEQHKSGKATGEGELSQAIISCRGLCEGWLYKTSQKTGFFQADLFHKRYYRLNLMSEELKIFDKPDGTLKQTLNLSQCITKIDMQLNKHILAEHEKKLGETRVTLPEFKHPFAVFTQNETMLLWANTQSDLRMWVKSFTVLMQATDSTLVENFQIQKTKKNKLVVGLYECLKISDDLVPSSEMYFGKRSRTIMPGSRMEAGKLYQRREGGDEADDSQQVQQQFESQQEALKKVALNEDKSPLNLSNMKQQLIKNAVKGKLKGDKSPRIAQKKLPQDSEVEPPSQKPPEQDSQVQNDSLQRKAKDETDSQAPQVPHDMENGDVSISAASQQVGKFDKAEPQSNVNSENRSEAKIDAVGEKTPERTKPLDVQAAMLSQTDVKLSAVGQDLSSARARGKKGKKKKRKVGGRKSSVESIGEDDPITLESSRVHLHRQTHSMAINVGNDDDGNGANDGASQDQTQQQKDETTTVGASSRFGRRQYRKSEATQNAGPIKIKKIIPQKDHQQQMLIDTGSLAMHKSPEQFKDAKSTSLLQVKQDLFQHQQHQLHTQQDLAMRQSMMSVQSGRTLGLGDIERASQSNKSEKEIEGDDDDDDDIERDPTADIIQPDFRRRNSSHTQKKLIKVKLKSKRPNGGQDDLRSSMTRSQLGFTKLSARAASGQAFEEKVKGQIDHNFIDTLIKNASKKSTGGASNSAWSGIAEDLREKLKIKAHKMTIEAVDSNAQASPDLHISATGKAPGEAPNTAGPSIKVIDTDGQISQRSQLKLHLTKTPEVVKKIKLKPLITPQAGETVMITEDLNVVPLKKEEDQKEEDVPSFSQNTNQDEPKQTPDRQKPPIAASSARPPPANRQNKTRNGAAAPPSGAKSKSNFARDKPPVQRKDPAPANEESKIRDTNGGNDGEEKELSDWDEDENERNFIIQQNSWKAGLTRRSSSIVNVRDRTVGLSNVFAGRDLSSNQIHRSLRASKHQANAAALVMLNRNKFTSSAMNFNDQRRQGQGGAFDDEEEKKQIDEEEMHRQKQRLFEMQVRQQQEAARMRRDSKRQTLPEPEPESARQLQSNNEPADILEESQAARIDDRQARRGITVEESGNAQAIDEDIQVQVDKVENIEESYLDAPIIANDCVAESFQSVWD